MRLSEMSAKEIRDWLKRAGHDSAKVDRMSMKDKAAKRNSLLEAHGVSERDIKMASRDYLLTSGKVLATTVKEAEVVVVKDTSVRVNK